jgi:galectin-4
LYINGRSKNNASRFEFNLLTGTQNGADVAFHFNPRFDQREAIRNSCQGGGWGAEEKQGGFPLQPGQEFEIQIICFPEHYQVRKMIIHFFLSAILSLYYFSLCVG